MTVPGGVTGESLGALLALGASLTLGESLGELLAVGDSVPFFLFFLGGVTGESLGELLAVGDSVPFFLFFLGGVTGESLGELLAVGDFVPLFLFFLPKRRSWSTVSFSADSLCKLNLFGESVFSLFAFPRKQ